MHTDKYLRLKKRLDKLKSIYLPPVFSPTGSYSDSDFEKVRAYEVLSHVEMEYYFEEVALAIAQKAYQCWQLKRKVSPPLLSLVAYYSGQFPSIPDVHSGNNSEKDIIWRINASYTSYNSQIRSSNNGIKEKNILSIFLPIGVNITSIDEGMLLALNNFGSERGIIAHSTRALTLTTPDDALASVTNIMTYIDAFDQYLASYKASIR